MSCVNDKCGSGRLSRLKTEGICPDNSCVCRDEPKKPCPPNENPLMIHTSDVFYNGCEFFNLGLMPGLDLTSILGHIDKAFNNVYDKIRMYREENIELKEKIKELEKKVKELNDTIDFIAQNGGGATDGTSM